MLWEDWLQKYAGDFFKMYQAFEGAHPTYRLPRWEVPSIVWNYPAIHAISITI